MSSPSKDPSAEAERLEHRADLLREDLDEIVGELDRRRHRLTRRFETLALIVVGTAVAVVVGLVLWRRHPS